MQTRINNYTGNTPELSQADVERFVASQDAILGEFATLAGVSLPGATGEWRPIIDAGIHYADVRCDRFMDSLFWFNRVRETTSRQIQYTGAAVSAALAVVQASVNAVGLTPLGFAFLDQTVNNFGAGLLYNLNPANVRTIVERKQEAFRTGLSASYTSRALALQVIQNYAAICLPPSIETEVELAISTQQYRSASIVPALPPAADDQIPDALGFADKEDVELSTVIESAWTRVSGIGATAPISISTGGAYQIGENGAWRTAAGTVPPNAMYRVRVTSSATPSTPATATLTIGGISGTFTVTTRAANEEAAVEVEEAPPLPEAEPVVTSPQQNAVPSPQPQG